MTLRGLRILGDVPLILAEDTRTARHLLKHHGIRGRLLSYTEHNHAERLTHVLAALREGDIALISEAGMPGINDPGQMLVAAVTQAGVTVVGLPGPSALPLAVALAGFPIASFIYLGFLPGKAAERRRQLQLNGWIGHAIVAFESPHRILATLKDLHTVLGSRRLAICRELTKLYEEIFRGTAEQALAHFKQPRGEFTLVIEAGETANAATAVTEVELAPFMAERAAAGDSGRDAVAAAVTRFGVNRRAAYKSWQSLSAGTTPAEPIS